MPTIDIDFEVFKELTNHRASESVTYNDVIRDLLKLTKPSKSAEAPQNGSAPWALSDATFPAGSEFRAEYKGEVYTGIVKDGMLQLSSGDRFSTPSAAAGHITGSHVNGWHFWKCRLPGTSNYVRIERLRDKTH